MRKALKSGDSGSEIVLTQIRPRFLPITAPTGKNKQRKIGNAYRLGLSSMALLEIQFKLGVEIESRFTTLIQIQHSPNNTSSPDRWETATPLHSAKPYISTCFVLGSISQPKRTPLSTYSRIFSRSFSSESLLERNSTRSQEMETPPVAGSRSQPPTAHYSPR